MSGRLRGATRETVMYPGFGFHSLQADFGNWTVNGTVDAVFDSILR